MTKLRNRVLSSRPALAAFSLALLLGSFAVTSQPAAASGVGCSGPGTITVYYNNAGKEVGRYTESCQGVCTGSGRITDSYDVLFIPCPPPGGGEA
jgi:archaellum component FlaG (FlaF/FlaG flagellin family)